MLLALLVTYHRVAEKKHSVGILIVLENPVVVGMPLYPSVALLAFGSVALIPVKYCAQ